MRTGRFSSATTRLLLVAAVVLTGCSFGDDPRPAPGSGWTSLTTTHEGSGITIERVRYRSGELDIEAQVCRPEAKGRHPVMIWNHGGFSGLSDWNSLKGGCAASARAGWVFAESSYRGEDDSDGRIEICDGEVDDVMAMIAVVRRQSYADTRRMAMSGISHGGCITARAVARDAPVDVAIDVAGTTDWAELWRFMTRESKRATAAMRPIYRSVVATLEQATGGTPTEVPEEYARRSPVTEADEIAAADIPLLVLHGSADAIVPASQACDLVREIGGFRAYQLAASGSVVPEAPASCEAMWWNVSSYGLKGFVSDRYFLQYPGVGHDILRLAPGRVAADTQRFLTAKIRPEVSVGSPGLEGGVE